jgi:hypothetical protein
MKYRSRRQSAFALTLCSAAAYSCLGTETGNPVTALPDVVEGTSPENFREPDAPPGCPPLGAEDRANVPTGFSRSVSVTTSTGTVLAVGGYAGGLNLVDMSDPAQPVTLSSGAVRGAIHQLLAGAPGRLWVAASEPPVMTGNAVPTAAALEEQLRLIELDVSDPTAPVRVAEVDLEGAFWELRPRGDQVWVVTARLTAYQRACDSPLNEPYSCGYRSYEAITVRGFHPNGAELEPIGEAELPYDRRAWWGVDGIGSVVQEGVHVVSWDGTGALRPPVTLDLPGGDAVFGPIDVIGDELRLVQHGVGARTLEVYSLGEGPVLERSAALGTDTTPLGAYSLFSGGRLWLQSPGSSNLAEVWDLAGVEPRRVELPAEYNLVLPIDGARREGQSDEVLAIGLAINPVTEERSASLLSFGDDGVSVLDAALASDSELYRYLGEGWQAPAPAGLVGTGDASSWQLRSRGVGLPLGIDPAAQPQNERVVSSIAVVLGATSEADPRFVQASLIDIEYNPGASAVRPNPMLEVTGGSTVRFELPPAASDLIPTRTGVVVVATTEVAQCEQSGRDCTGYAPGVSVFELTGEPRLTGALPFPALPFPPTDANRFTVSWRMYDYYITKLEQLALPLDDRHLAFVAQVDLSCDTQEDCDTLGLVAVPIAEANVVVGGQVTCPPSDIEPNCVPMPAPVPTVYGTGQRQYFYVLDLDAPGAPAWQSWGASSLEATSARTDRDSRFAAPIATDRILAATRLERRTASGDVVTQGEARFMLDRFERQPSGEPIALPPVNVRGYPQARLGTNAGVERWISVEAAPGATGHAQLLRMNIRDDGARIERALDLDGGSFAGFRLLDLETDVGTNLETKQRLGLALMTPDDGCGTTRLSAIRLGTNTGDAAEPLELASTLELPADRWTLTAADGEYVLLSHGFVYVLVHVDATGILSIADTRASDVALYDPQLLGTTLFGSGPSGSRLIELTPAP